MNTNIKKLVTFIKYAFAFFFTLLLALFMAFVYFTQSIEEAPVPGWLSASAVSALVLLFAYQVLLLYANWIESWIAPKPDKMRAAAISVGFAALFFIVASIFSAARINAHSLSGDINRDWVILFSCCAVMLLSLAFSHLSLPLTKKKMDRPHKANDDIFFITLNETGAICAALSFVLIMLSHTAASFRAQLDTVVLICSVVTLVPWSMMMLGWYLSKRKKVTRWREEKSFKDMGRASMISMVITIAVSLLFYILSVLVEGCNLSAVWFPAVLISSVLSFCALNSRYAVY